MPSSGSSALATCRQDLFAQRIALAAYIVTERGGSNQRKQYHTGRNACTTKIFVSFRAATISLGFNGWTLA
jgi:hypothetical protein